ncbi:hypothetical protein VB636_04085 [Paracoccus sp. APAP_BH8]|uniref:hypothetical protein n=1 Tax=Paracoccus sp. TD-10 TaxID=3395918 RepID=UPI003AAFD90A
MVEAGSIRIAALGTQSSADLQAGDVEVWVAEHSARVEPVAGPAAPVVLAEGMGVDAGPHAIPAPVPRDMHLAHAWRSGELVFDDRPLAEVVAALHRHRHGSLLLLTVKQPLDKLHPGHCQAPSIRSCVRSGRGRLVGSRAIGQGAADARRRVAPGTFRPPWPQMQHPRLSMRDGQGAATTGIREMVRHCCAE